MVVPFFNMLKQTLLLRDALIAGENSGEPRTFDRDAFQARMHQKNST